MLPEAAAAIVAAMVCCSFFGLPARHRRAPPALGLAALLAAGCLPAPLGASVLVDPIRTPVIDRSSIPHRSITFRSLDAELSGWLFEPTGKPRGLVVFLHGRGANRAWGAEAADALIPRGYAVLTYDQRAHGRSGGDYCTYGYLEKQDLSRAIDALGIAPVYVIGHSLGAAVALQAAAVEPRVRAVVAAAPFSDLRTIVRERAPRFAGETDVLASIKLAEEKAGFHIDSISPQAAAARISVPVLLVHGTRDTSIRPDHSRRIFSALHGEKRLLVVEGATHYDVLRHPIVWSRITDFLETLSPPI